MVALGSPLRRGHAVGIGSLPAAPPAAFALGINLSGFEGGQYASSGGPAIVSAMQSTYLPYFAAKGFVKVRLPFDWGRMQPAVDGDLDPTYLGYVKAVVATASGLGMQVRLDCHSYGSGPGGLLGSAGQPQDTFGRFWGKMTTAFLGVAGVTQFDLMNEWHDMDPSTNDGVNPATDYAKALVFNATQGAISAIRAIDMTKVIVIEGLHFTGAWDWLSNNTGLFGLVDPANNHLFSAHCYLDNDSSGTNFGWQAEAAKPGASPPGVPSTATIGVTRLTPFFNEIARRGLRADVGEFGASNDYPPFGTDDYQDWNTALDTMIAFGQANNAEMYYFCAGPGYDSYPMGVNAAGGFQARQMVILDKYHGFPGPQPTNYLLSAGSNRGSVGVASAPFKVDYRGRITTPVTITPHAALVEGQNAGGTFTPASLTLPVGLNALATFTYTPAASGTFAISTTNSAGWTDPSALGFGSKADSFVGLAATARNVFALRRLVSPYIGPCIRLKRPDGAQLDFGFLNNGDLPRQAMQDWAGSRSITPLTVYDQSGGGNHLTFNAGAEPVLTLSNAQDYPEITWASGRQGQFNSYDSGQTGQTIIARLNEASSAAARFVSQEFYVGPFEFGASAYKLSGQAGVNLSVAPGRIAGAWHTYAGTAKSAASGGLRGFLDGALQASVTTTAFAFAPAGNQSQSQMGYFKFATENWVGSWQSAIILTDAITDAQVAAFASDDASYYGTALTPLTAVGTVPETPYAAPTGTWTPVGNLKGLNISGGENNTASTRPYGYDYVYPQTNELDYATSKGFGIIRVPVDIRRVQPASYGLLDATQLGYIKGVIDYAYGKGLRVIIDPHNYGGITDTNTNTYRHVGADSEGTAQFADWWMRTATKFKNYPNVVLGLMNEPSQSGVSAAQWKTGAAAAITAIRGAGASQLILIPGVGFTAAYHWTLNGNAAAWAGFNGDPSNNFMFEMHQYLDTYNTGNVTTVGAGLGHILLDNPSDGLATTWCRNNGFKAFLGEFGWNASDTQSSGGVPSTEGRALMDFMSANADVWAGWTYWLSGSRLFYTDSYSTGAVPDYSTTPPTDPPQMSIITAHL